MREETKDILWGISVVVFIVLVMVGIGVTLNKRDKKAEALRLANYESVISTDKVSTLVVDKNYDVDMLKKHGFTVVDVTEYFMVVRKEKVSAEEK
jgi:hypothetical protein